MTAVAAHELAPKAFGAFSVALTTYICVLWVARSMVGEPFVVRMTESSPTEQIGAARGAVGAALLLGSLTGFAAVGLGMVIGGMTGLALATMGVFLPVLLSQDADRYVLMAQGRARAAAANDGTWLLVQTCATGVLLAFGRSNVVVLIAAFGGGAAGGAILGLWQTGARPSLGPALRWLRTQSSLWVPFLLELLVVSATPQLSMLAVAALGDVLVVGAARAGLFLFAPLGVLFSGAYLVALPEAVRIRSRSLRGLKLFVASLAIGMSALTFLWAGGISLVPDRLGRALLGTNWAPGRGLLWPIAAFTAASAVILSAIVGLRALDVARRTIRARLWLGPVVFASGIVGAELSGASGMTKALATSSWLSAGLAWFILQKAIAEALVQQDIDLGNEASVGILGDGDTSL